MREIVLDTETTGLDPETGDRIVEIGAIELWNHLPTGKTFHKYLNPERNMPEEALAVHGLTEEFLKDKPVFSQIADDFLAFIKDSKLIIHNASFDMKFINAELALVEKTRLPGNIAIDTLGIARKKFPGSPASLDALCRRFNIDNSARTMHGALLDSEILAEVYLELIGGRQPDFGLSDEHNTGETKVDEKRQVFKRPGKGLRLILVITGKGRNSEDYDVIPKRKGVLKATVPNWLSMEPLSSKILQITNAHVKHGGGGAFYVYLRKKR